MVEQILQPVALEISNLKKEYADGKENKVVAVDDISFSVKTGEIFSFLGPNGAGKSTTISIAATQIQQTSGTVKIFGNDIQNRKAVVRKHIGICPQELVFYDYLTVKENLLFFGKMNNTPQDKLNEYAMNLIAQVGLTEKMNTIAAKLSGGMKRRLNLILAFINEPKLLFLDEPTAGLDPQTRRWIWDFLLQMKKKGMTIFLTTHYMDEADILSDRVAIIDHGKIVALDSPFDLKRKYSKGDIIEFKFQELDEEVEKKLAKENQSSNTTENLSQKSVANHFFKDVEYFTEDHLFRIHISEGLTKIPQIIEILNSLQLHISDMNIKANSLENVFLNLTGRQIRN